MSHPDSDPVATPAPTRHFRVQICTADGNLEESLIRAESHEAARARADVIAEKRGDQILEVTPVAEGLRDGVCCKCGSHRVAKYLQLPVGSPGELPAVLRAVISWPARFVTSSKVTACICATCGYAELYADPEVEKIWLEIEGRTS